MYVSSFLRNWGAFPIDNLVAISLEPFTLAKHVLLPVDLAEQFIVESLHAEFKRSVKYFLFLIYFPYLT
jgi:hypothetical protein